MNEVVSNILGNLATFAPIIFLFYLANLSERGRTAENPGRGKELGIVCYTLVVIGYAGSFLLGLLIHLAGLFMNGPAGASIRQSMQQELQMPLPGVSGILNQLDEVGLGIWLPSLIAMLVLIFPIRKGIAKIIPIDPVKRTHALSLSMSMLVFIQFFVTLGVGLATLSELPGQPTGNGVLASLWSQDILLFILGLIGVGWLSRRTLPESLSRLGLVKPSGRQLLAGLGIGIGLMSGALALEFAAGLLGLTADPHVEELTQKMLGPLFTSIPGILTLGLAAAIGEETIFRGALQPRFGLIFTTLLFALVHANYGFSIATVIVFLVGLCLAFVRNYINTTVSMVVHATYNIGLGVLTLFMP
ncbi:CPBP family intramembrane glutamic endopeptidase [Lihuaxuella thermophila]|nr:type II CAAX endopeptidase family protein [Lihuaxuella thermophila]